MKARTFKPKDCKNPACGKEFTPSRFGQTVCGYLCGLAVYRNKEQRLLRKAKLAKQSVWRQEKATRLEKLKPISTLLKEAQREYNRYIRERDWSRGCISCHMPATYSGQWQAGHYRTTAAAPHLRFHDDNVSKQCSQCNGPKSGNIVEYRKGLVLRIGLVRVEAIENDNRTVKWDRDEIVAMRKRFTAAWRGLKASREAKGMAA